MTLRQVHAFSPTLSRLSLGHSGQLYSMPKPNESGTVVHALKNLRDRQLKDAPAENILITLAKDGWHENGVKKAAGPFVSGSKLFQGANWAAKIPRGTTV